MISQKHFHPLRRIFYVFKNTFDTDTNFRVFFFWYEGEFIEQEGSRRDFLFVFSKTTRKEGTSIGDLISQKHFYF
jgi:hypothetical protein